MRRKLFSIFFALVLVLSFSLVTAAPATAATLNVPDPYETIQEAIVEANPGDTIVVAEGEYDENVVITKALTLYTEEDAEISPTTGHAVEIQASDVTVEGFIITPQDGTHQSAMGILIDAAEGTSGVTISNNTIVTLTGDPEDGNHGIWIDGSSGSSGPTTDLTISGNDITVGGYADAVYAAHSDPPHSGWLISGNTFSAPDGDSIDLYDVDDMVIDDNIFGPSLDSSVIITSILSDLAGPIVFTNNDVQGNTNGSMVAFLTDFFGDEGVDTTMDDVTITGNTFDNWAAAARALRIGVGGTADNITNVTINYNEFLGTGTGLQNNTTAEIDAENNYWGSENGPVNASNTFNVGDQGVTVVETGGAVDYVPWYDTDKDGDSFAPVNNTDTDAQFSSIGAATDNATAGDTITCAAGTYTEGVYIDKSLTLLGAGAATTTIDGNGDDVVYITLDSGDVTVSGFSVINGKFGIHLVGIVNGSSVNINHNIITGNWLCGIRGSTTGVDSASSVTIEENVITDNDLSGISFYDVSGESTLNIFRNTIYDNDEKGVKVTHLTDNSALTMTGNIVGGWYDIEEDEEYDGNGYSGIIISYIEDSTVTIGGDTEAEGNTIADNGWVDSDESAGITVWSTDNATLTIQGNILGAYEVDDSEISGNYWTGIYLGGDGGLTDSTVLIGGDTPAEGNLISGNAYEGMYIYELYGTSLQILNNDILENNYSNPGNGYGIDVEYVDEDSSVEIHYNSIVDNDYGFYYYYGDVTADATLNWWGDVAGPYDYNSPDGYYNPYNWLGPGTQGDYVYGDGPTSNIDYIPWLIQSELTNDWNIWSRPIVPDEDSWEQFKDDLVEAGVDTIYYFNSATQYWGTDPDDSGLLDAWYIKKPEDVSTLTIRYYFSSEATMPSQKAMKVGWNFIGLAQLYHMSTYDSVSDAYYGTGVAATLAGYNKVMSPSLNGATWTYLRDNGDGPPMFPTRGYWVFMVNNGNLGGFTSTPIVEELD